MLAGQQVHGQWWSVGQALEHRVQETGVAHVAESRADRAGLGPVHLNLVPVEQGFGGQAETVGVLLVLGRGRR